MVLYPDVYKKAQEELDRAVGTDRLPTSEDRPLLPYVNSVLMETYRYAIDCLYGANKLTS